jgi:hypothetical protein
MVDEHKKQTTLPDELERRADDVLYTERVRDWGKAGEPRWGKGLRDRARSTQSTTVGEVGTTDRAWTPWLPAHGRGPCIRWQIPGEIHVPGWQIMQHKIRRSLVRRGRRRRVTNPGLRIGIIGYTAKHPCRVLRDTLVIGQSQKHIGRRPPRRGV